MGGNIISTIQSSSVNGTLYVDFKCPSNGECIALSKKCDGIADCEDGYDELNDCDLCISGKFLHQFNTSVVEGSALRELD